MKRVSDFKQHWPFSTDLTRKRNGISKKHFQDSNLKKKTQKANLGFHLYCNWTYATHATLNSVELTCTQTFEQNNSLTISS